VRRNENLSLAVPFFRAVSVPNFSYLVTLQGFMSTYRVSAYRVSRYM